MWPFGVALRGEASSHLELRWLTTVVVSVEERRTLSISMDRSLMFACPRAGMLARRGRLLARALTFGASLVGVTTDLAPV